MAEEKEREREKSFQSWGIKNMRNEKSFKGKVWKFIFFWIIAEVEEILGERL